MTDEMKGLPGLKLEREQRGVTQAALARSMEVPERQIARWERCETSPSVWDAYELARHMGTTIEALIGMPMLPGDGRREAP